MVLDVIVMLVGLLMYVIGKHTKVVEIGRIMFAFGLLALLLSGVHLPKIITIP